MYYGGEKNTLHDNTRESLNDVERIFHKSEEKNNKTFCQKKVLVCSEVSHGLLRTQKKLFSAKCFIIFLSRL